MAVGDTISLRVRETNTGESILTNVHVTGTDSCANWAAEANKNGGAGAFAGSLNPTESVDFTCSFDAPADNSFSWSALGHGTDEKGDAAPATNEDESGSYDILMPATKLTIDTARRPRSMPVTPSPSSSTRERRRRLDQQRDRDRRQVVCDLDTGSGLQSSLAAGASVKFSCTFNAPRTTSRGRLTVTPRRPRPRGPVCREHVQGNVDVVKPATN